MTRVSNLLQSFRIGCDADGWMVMANKEPSYPHFFHAMSPTEISAVKVTGDVEIGYIGFGSKGSITQRITYFLQNLYPFRFTACPAGGFQPDLCLSRGGGQKDVF